MKPSVSESTVEEFALAWLESLGYAVESGPDIASGEPQAERENHHKTVLKQHFSSTLLPKFTAGQSHIDEENR